MTYWYVDTENALTSCEILVENVKRYDRVVFAYSTKMSRLPIQLLDQLSKKQVKVEFLKCIVGSPNAMDFQIMMQISYNIALGVGNAHKILTEDKGFIAPAKAWVQRGYDVYVVRPSVYYARISPLLPKIRKQGVSEAFAPTLARLITECRAGFEPRKELHAAIEKLIGTQEESNKIYDLVKDMV